ncbi:MAG TPA: hypothetical protein VMO26_16580 [Vicinamibacterales bacterium]|nr:hypothetical protein [Vicinamibacterales bacterium]
MTIWGLAGAAYGVVLALAALTQPIRRRHRAFAASGAYALASLAAGSLGDDFFVNLFVPGGLLLSGYWLSGFFFRDPQPWLDAWLLRVDHALGAERWVAWTPRAMAEFLELSYAAVHPVVGGGAIYAATFGTEAVAHYWSLVLTSALASYAPLPWLRSRPPRMVEEGIRAKPGPRAEGPPSATPHSTPRPPACPEHSRGACPERSRGARSAATLRRLNTLILDHASVQANTLPSGHVSGAVAAALGVMAVDVVVGSWLMVAAAVIAIASVAGRYHYVIDCMTGAAVALTIWRLM